MAGPSFRLDLRTALPVAAIAVVLLVILFVELCGREDVDRDALVSGEVLPTETLGPTPTTGPSPTPGPTATLGPTPTINPTEAAATAIASVGAEGRDAVRNDDLSRIAGALAQYFDDNGEYPSTGGNVQTLCVFEDDDVGCALGEYLGDVPVDPLEPAATEGYWYASDGSAYNVFAQRETDVFPECQTRPDHLAEFDSLLCVEGP